MNLMKVLAFQESFMVKAGEIPAKKEKRKEGKMDDKIKEVESTQVVY